MESIMTRIEMLNFRASIERSDALIPRYGCMLIYNYMYMYRIHTCTV